MRLPLLAASALIALGTASARTLPVLRAEPAPGGSVFFVRNASALLTPRSPVSPFATSHRVTVT